jgi:hypothetical protein
MGSRRSKLTDWARAASVSRAAAAPPTNSTAPLDQLATIHMAMPVPLAISTTPSPRGAFTMYPPGGKFYFRAQSADCQIA